MVRPRVFSSSTSPSSSSLLQNRVDHKGNLGDEIEHSDVYDEEEDDEDEDEEDEEDNEDNRRAMEEEEEEDVLGDDMQMESGKVALRPLFGRESSSPGEHDVEMARRKSFSASSANMMSIQNLVM